KYDAALAVLTRLLAQKPTDWELMYREGVSLAKADKFAEAAKRFQGLLDLKLSDETESAAVKWRKKQKPGRQTGASFTSSQPPAQQGYQGYQPAFQPESVPLQARIQAVYQVRRDCGLDMQNQYYGPGQQMPRIWVPDDF